MTKDVGILVLGLIVAAMPFLGFPSSIERIIFIVSGLLIASLAFFIRGEVEAGVEKTESYAQNGSSKRETDGMTEGENDAYNEEEANQE